MRHAILVSAAAMLAAGAAWAEVSNTQTGTGVVSGQEYVPDEGGTFTQVTATGTLEEELPSRFVDLGPLPGQPPQVVGAGAEGDLAALGDDPGALIELGSNYRSSLLYELPTFLAAEPGAVVLLSEPEPGGGGSVEPPTPPMVPLPAAGLMLLAAAGALLALRARA